MKYGIIIHGGAWDIPNNFVDNHLDGINNALKLGYSLLEDNNNAIDIAEKVVVLLENDPTFDAGKGSFLNALGKVEMDAIIATDDYKIGSVAALNNYPNPIKIARAIYDFDGAVMLVGEGAKIFAEQLGFQQCKVEDLLVGRELERYLKIKKDATFVPKDAFRRKTRGTVGAVVLDKKGRMAVAVSTGGTPKKPPGRVGDTPLFGAGAYIEKDKLGVAATGYGEDLIKALISKRVLDFFDRGLSPLESTEQAISFLSKNVQGLGGVIALGKKGVGLAFNTPRMAFGVQTDEIDSFIGINQKDKEELSKQL
ncbi:MAG: isoaspartyl peptidase/L-asparaginase [Candidatus Heimdallarchaeaceae archaeon]